MARVNYRLVLAGLAVVLLTLAAFAIGSSQRTRAASQRTARTTAISDAFTRASATLGDEELLQLKYRLQPSVSIRVAHEEAARTFDEALAEAERAGTPADGYEIRRLVAMHRGLVDEADALFAHVDAGGRKGGLEAITTPLAVHLSEISTRLDASATARSLESSAALAQLRSTERSVAVATPPAFLVGLLLLVFLTVVLARINRQLARSAADSTHAALHDALTGLPNRLLLAERLEHTLGRAARDGAPFSLVMLDLDRFKEINDTLGHACGDVVLKEIGPRLAPLLRRDDSLARLGGDEFALVLPSTTTQQAQGLCDGLLAALRAPFTLGEATVTVGASAGIVTWPTHADDAAALLQRADIAMYQAKGKNGGAVVYDPADDPYDAERLSLLGDLRDAISHGELELHYQPKLSAETMRLVGVEALVRWRHPVHGLLSPDRFVPLAEHTGLIRPLTVEVMRIAARQCQSWFEQEGIEVGVAVNLSVANLLDDGIVDDVAEALASSRLPAGRLILEITEGTAMSDPERTVAMLERLARMGVELSIDDYGTGYSSLAYLQRLPVDELKIDRAFVTSMATDPKAAQIVRSTVELAHSLGLRVVAEGVEDAVTLDTLRAYGCDLMQGYHVGRPVPVDALLDVLRGDRAPALEGAVGMTPA